VLHATAGIGSGSSSGSDLDCLCGITGLIQRVGICERSLGLQAWGVLENLERVGVAVEMQQRDCLDVLWVRVALGLCDGRIGRLEYLLMVVE